MHRNLSFNGYHHHPIANDIFGFATIREFDEDDLFPTEEQKEAAYNFITLTIKRDGEVTWNPAEEASQYVFILI